MSPLVTIIFAVAGIFFVIIVIGLILTRLYARASKEISFVRTGLGGQKVIMNGGALVFPVLHEIIPVNMSTLRLEVQRSNEQALITRDRMRVDVQAEFYVRVKPTIEAIADAAQTLARRTMDPDMLKELIEGKFVDALRSVAAEMAIEELHEQRVDFVQKVQTAVSEDLLKNGLELESVSLTALDQTDQRFFNPQNLFDATGLTKLTQEIQARSKQRNDVERDTEIEIKQKNLSTERQKLEIAKEEQYAKFEQEREIELRRAEQMSTIAKERAEKERLAKEAQILAKQQVDQRQLMAERAVEQDRIEKEKLIKEKDIEKEKGIETAQIERQKAVTLADQSRAIAIAEKSKEKSIAQAEADKALALAVKQEEQVITAKETEIAERIKIIELIEARKKAEKDAIEITVAAEAQKKASVDKSEAVRIIAMGEADKVKITAQAEANAEVIKAEAAKKRYEVDAAGTRALHESENILAANIIDMRVKMAVIENIEKIIRESVKPIEKIESIKIFQVDGLNPGSHPHISNSEQKPVENYGNLGDQVINSALKYRCQAPLIDSILQEIGLTGGSLSGLSSLLNKEVILDNNSSSNSNKK
ncbi:MAG: flotillin family protein [Desulfobacterales bacterium]|nr:flotillin family protein [Desulfobacterales bacterium]